MEPGYLFPFASGRWPADLARAKSVAGRHGPRSGDPRASLDFRCGCSTCQGEDDSEDLAEDGEEEEIRGEEASTSTGTMEKQRPRQRQRQRSRQGDDDDYEDLQEEEEEIRGAQESTSLGTMEQQRPKPRRRSKQRQRPQWRKALYIPQPYADNHTDPETFLSGLVMNADVSTPSYWPTVEASLVVAHEVATVALVVAVFAFNYLEVLSLSSLYSLNVSFLIGGLMLAGLAEAGAALENQQAGAPGNPSAHSSSNLQPQSPKVPVSPRTPRSSFTSASSQHNGGIHIPLHSPGISAAGGGAGANGSEAGVATCASPTASGVGKEGFQGQVAGAVREWWTVVSTCALIGLYTLLVSPILHTLARSISSDTIWCTTTYLLLLHLFLHDYSYLAALSATFSSYLALLSALFACVLLSSRLPEPENAFAFVSFGLQCFGLLPGILHRVARASQRSHRVVVVLLLTLSVGLVCLLNELLGVTLIIVLLFVVIVSPGVLVHMHRSYKSTIQGPWDEAKLHISLAPSGKR